MTTANLERFRLKLREYRLLVNRNQSDLAAYLNLDYNELSNRLNAHKNAHLSHDNVRAIVRALAEWGAITTRSQAVELLEMMFCPDFDPADLQARPLSKLIIPSLPNPSTPTPTPSPVSSTRPPPTLPEPTNNLPQQLSSFIGRRKEVTELKKLVAQEKGRLVTLVGAGGCGKTRLSLEVAAELWNSFGEGVWLVELAPLSDPTLLAQTIATTLGLSEQSGRPILTTLSDYLRSRHLLLVLDNCEHLVEECAKLVDRLIRASTNLHILTSSREALGINGEITYRVPSLSLPDPQTLPELETLASYEAVRLFMERATAVNPAFSLTSQNAGMVVQVCRQLDGIPLAIELAAARIKVLTPEQLAAKLDDRFRLLTGGSRTALPRQQTLRALIDWSYELLNPAEKRLLAHLSVFSGGWTLSAAEAIGGEGLEVYEILEALTGLVNKSLVQLEDYQDKAEARYSCLETIRQYGLEKLKARGEERAVRQRHLTYYSRLVGELSLKINTSSQVEALKQMDSELDNIRAAIEYALRLEQAEAVVQMTRTTYWDIRGYYSEDRHYLEQFMALPTAKGVIRGWALFVLGFLTSRQTDVEASRRYYEECMVVSNEYEDKELRMYAFYGMSHIHWEQMDFEVARRYYEQALSVSEELSGIGKLAIQIDLGITLVQLGDYSEARHLFEELEASVREMGNQSFLAMLLGAQSRLAMVLEDYTAAHRYLAEMQSLSEEIGFHLGKIDVLCYRGMVWTNEGRFDLARKSLDETLVLCLKGGMKNVTSNGLVGVAQLLTQVWQQRGEVGQPEQVACLAGAIGALVGFAGSKSPMLVQPILSYYKEAVGMAQSSLDETAYGVAFARGEAMSLEEAIAYARQALAVI